MISHQWSLSADRCVGGGKRDQRSSSPRSSHRGQPASGGVRQRDAIWASSGVSANPQRRAQAMPRAEPAMSTFSGSSCVETTTGCGGDPAHRRGNRVADSAPRRRWCPFAHLRASCAGGIVPERSLGAGSLLRFAGVHQIDQVVHRAARTPGKRCRGRRRHRCRSGTRQHARPTVRQGASQQSEAPHPWSRRGRDVPRLRDERKAARSLRCPRS